MNRRIQNNTKQSPMNVLVRSKEKEREPLLSTDTHAQSFMLGLLEIFFNKSLQISIDKVVACRLI